jgi:hypothetical protein
MRVDVSSSRIDLSSSLGQPAEHLLPREGDRDLAFTGWLVGEAQQVIGTRFMRADGSDPYRKIVDVQIFVTPGGAIVTACRRFEQPLDASAARAESVTAAAHRKIEDAIAWLKNDAGGKLGPAGKTAWVNACRSVPELAAQEYERVG